MSNPNPRRDREDLDDRDEAILLERVGLRSRIRGPRVGDFCILRNGDVRRFAHDWGDDIQPSSKGDAGSFYLQPNGHLDYSGGLDPAIPKSSFRAFAALREGRAWFFSHDVHRAGNGVTALIPCRVYEEVAP